MTIPLESPRPLSDRLEQVREVFSPVGAAPAASSQMYAADDAVAEKLDSLTAEFSGPTDQDLEAAGEAWAKGKGKSKITAALAEPTTEGERFAVIYRAASRALLAKYDLPEYSTASLVAECSGQVGEYLDAVAAEATRVLEALPTSTLDMLNSGRGRLDQVDRIDVQTMPVEQITAHRDAAAVWSTVYEVLGGGHRQRSDWERMFRVSATGSLTGGHELKFADGPAAVYAVWFDAPGCAALAAGFKVSEVLTGGLGSLRPVANPFGDGEDAEVYRHRVAAYNGVLGWAGTQDNVMAARLRAYEPLLSAQAAVKRSHRDYNAIQRAGYLTPAAALDAYLSDRPQFRADVDQDAAAQ